MAPRPPLGAPPASDPDAAFAALRVLLGSASVWWLPDQRQAWAKLWEILDVGPERRVIVPVGAEPAIAETAQAHVAAIIEADLDPASASPIWPAHRGEMDGRNDISTRDVFVIDHRFGLPTLLPPPRADTTVIEDATAAVGGSLGGRPVGSLGQVSLVRLGVPPFGRSRGALIATHDERWARAAAALLSPFDAAPEDAGWLHDEATTVADWVAGCRAAAQVYESAWRGMTARPATLLHSPGAEATYSAYTVVVPDPDELARDLAKAGVESRRPINDRLRHLLDRPGDDNLPGARALYRQALILPNHPGLGLGELLHVADVVRRHLAERPRG